MNIVYVGDVVNGHILAAEKGRRGERYILGGANMTHKAIFQKAAHLLGGRAPFIKLPLPVLRFSARAIETLCGVAGVEPWISADLVSGAGMYNWYSSAKAEREFGYTSTSFEKTILAAYKWYSENGFL